MKPKPWNTDDPDFLSSTSQRPPLLGRLALCLIAVSLVAFVALSEMLSDWNAATSNKPPVQVRIARLSEMLSDWNAATASPPPHPYVLLANPPGIAPPGPQPLAPEIIRQAPKLPRDRFMKVAPSGLDERAIVASRPGLDERIILNPYRNDERRTAAVLPIPQPGTPRVGRIVTPGPDRPPLYSIPVPFPPKSR